MIFCSAAAENHRGGFVRLLVILVMARVVGIGWVVCDEEIFNIELDYLNMLTEREWQNVNHGTGWLRALRIAGSSGLQNQRHFSSKTPEDAAPVGHAGASGRVMAGVLDG